MTSLPFPPYPFPHPAPAPGRSWSAAVLLSAALFAFLSFLYAPSLDYGFIFLDDRGYVSDPVAAGGFGAGNVLRAFTEFPERDQYIPVTRLSFLADRALFGPSPRTFHRTNVLLHALSMSLLLLVLWRATGALGRSAFAAALVALHPMRVESVAWVAERKDVLALLFLVLSVACHLRAARSGRLAWHGALLLAALLGMLSKPVLVVLPLLLLLLDYWPLGRFRPAGEGGGGGTGGGLRPVLEKAPMALLSLLLSAATLHLQGVEGIRRDTTWLSRVEHALGAPLVYLRQSFLPSDLGFRYFRGAWDGYAFPSLAALLLLAGVTATALLLSGKRPWLLAGWLWFLVALAPVSGIVPTGVNWIADRFTYLPHVGLAVAVSWAAAEPFRRFGPRPTAAAALALLSLLSLLTWRQLPSWRDGVALLERGLPYNGGDGEYRIRYVEELLDRGETERARAELPSILPWSGDRRLGIGVQRCHLEILERTGDRAGAIEAAREYLRRDPGFWKTRLLLAGYLLDGGRFTEAAAEYGPLAASGLLPPPEQGHALEGLALSLEGAGRPAEAEAAFLAGLAVDPRSPSLHYNLAVHWLRAGRRAEAEERRAEAARLAPEEPRFREPLSAPPAGKTTGGTP
jgi:tetratricopeptide (TPR) repeat protein